MQWNIVQPKNKGDSAICNYMEEPGGYYALWNKSDAGRKKLYDLTLLWKFKKQLADFEVTDIIKID